MRSKIFYLRTMTSTHFGTGRGEGVIDLPIARETTTGLPLAPGSGIKGVLRDQEADQDLRGQLYGPGRNGLGNGSINERSGILSPQDAHLLCLPVRSLKGTCAWVASPLTLVRYRREAERCGKSKVPDTTALTVHDKEVVASASETLSFPIQSLEQQKGVVLAELVRFVANDTRKTQSRDGWAKYLAEEFFKGEDDLPWADRFKERFVIVHDDTLVSLAQSATDVRARVALNADRVVIKGMNWYEENLPAETLLWGVMGAQHVRAKPFLSPDDALKKLETKILQMGGKATVGRGVVQFLI